MIRKPDQIDIEGYFNLGSFEIGHVYDVHPTIGALFVVEGWGVPEMRQTSNDAWPRLPQPTDGKRRE